MKNNDDVCNLYISSAPGGDIIIGPMSYGVCVSSKTGARMIKEEQLDDTVFHFHSALFKLVYGVPLEFEILYLKSHLTPCKK